jgi:hypothetical protein
MAEHPADGLDLHPVFPPLDGKRAPELMACCARHASNPVDTPIR